MTEYEKRKSAEYGEYREEEREPFEETYPDGSVKNECWRSPKKGSGMPRRSVERPQREPED